MSLRLQSTAAKSNALPVMLIGGRVVPCSERHLESVQLHLGRALALMYKYLMCATAPACIWKIFP